MATIHLALHGLNSDFDSYIKSLDLGDEPVCLLTNIDYSPTEEGRMAELIESKLKVYPPKSIFYRNVHEIAPLITNLFGDVLVLDNLNLWISNVLLLYNSSEQNWLSIVRRLAEEIDILFRSRDKISFRNIYIIGSETDFDFHVTTALGRLYQRLNYYINLEVARLADHVTLLTNGAELKVTIPELKPKILNASNRI